MASYLRYHRKKSGLTQRELAEIVGTLKDHQVARHENAKAIPSLYAAIGYQVVFKVSFAELFPGVFETVQQNVEQRLLQLEQQLQQSTPKNVPRAEKTAHQLVWLRVRQDEPELSR